MSNACLLQFKKLTRADLAAIAPHFEGKHTGSADYSVLYFYMWDAYLHTEFALHGDVLYLRRNTKHGVFYYPPLRIGSTDLVEDIPLLARVTDGNTLDLCAIPEGMVERVEAHYTVLERETSRRWADYVYAAEDLATLRGHRYNKKRNLVKQFERLYEDRTYEELSRENIGEVAAFVRRMIEEIDMSEDERFENERVLEVLEDYLTLPLCGGLVRVNGRVAAFSIGELIDDTLLVHIEKADRSLKGAYQYINHCFVKEQLARTPFTLVNREDDTGDEGLRQAKLSYHPVQILHKYHMKLKNDFGGEGK